MNQPEFKEEDSTPAWITILGGKKFLLSLVCILICSAIAVFSVEKKVPESLIVMMLSTIGIYSASNVANTRKGIDQAIASIKSHRKDDVETYQDEA